MTISCGFAQYEDSESINTFISRADNALYLSKNGGRNRITKG